MHVYVNAMPAVYFYLEPVTLGAPVFLLGVSFEECKCLWPRHSLIYLLIYLCTYLSVPLCLPVAHSFFFSLLRDRGLPHLPVTAPLHGRMHTRAWVPGVISPRPSYPPSFRAQ